MSLAQIAPTSVVLGVAATPLPQFGTSAILGVLTTAQYGKFIAQSGGTSVIEMTPASVASLMTSLGLVAGERAYEDATAHFSQARKPEKAYLAYRGDADQIHQQTVQILPESGTTDRASLGKYSLTNVEGGPYSHTSSGVAQVVTLTVVDAGGGNGATGSYVVQDAAGLKFQYDSGGINVWTVTIATAAAGLYRLTVDGENYDYTAGAGDTIENIRDGLFAETLNTVAHPPHPDWTGNKVSTDQFTITGNNVGQSLVVSTNNGPDTIDDMTVVETTPIVPETVGAIATGIATAITGAATPPSNWTPVDAAATVTITADAGFEGTDLGIVSNGPSAGDLTQVLTTDHRDSVQSVRDALDTALAASHPTFVNATSGTDTLTIDGVSAGVVIGVDVSAPNDNILLSEVQGVLTLRTAQTTRITIVENPADNLAYDGTYELTAFGTQVSYVASSETTTSVRDAIRALVDAEISEVTTALAGADAFDMTSNTQGQTFGVVLSSPNGDAAMTQAVQSAARTIRDDIDRAITDAPDAYIFINSGTAVDIVEAQDHIDDIAASTPRFHVWQSGNDAMIDTPIAGATDEGALTFASGTLRSKGHWHPEPVSELATAKAYEGVVAAWVGSYTTLLPGQVQPSGKRLTGFTSRNRLTPTQESNLEARAVQHLEFVPSLGASGSQVSQRRLVPSGRLIDMARAIDQMQSVYQTLAADFITTQPIIHYTDLGLVEIHNAVVQRGTDFLRDQGLVIDGPNYVAGRLPKRADATDADRQLGVTPIFDFEVTIDLGITEIIQRINVFQ